MRKQHVAVLTTIALVVLCSVHTARDARADTAGGALTDATGASTQSQARMRYITAGDNHTCIVLSNNSVESIGSGSLHLCTVIKTTNWRHGYTIFWQVMNLVSSRTVLASWSIKKERTCSGIIEILGLKSEYCVRPLRCFGQKGS